MTFYDRLQKMPEENQAKAIKLAVKEGIKTDFGEWVLTHLRDYVESLYHEILGEIDPDRTTRLAAQLQIVERLKAELFEGALDDRT